MTKFEQPDLGDESHLFILDTTGGVWVTGTHSFSIPFRSRPINPQCSFIDVPTCGPAPSPLDTCSAEAVNMGFPFRPRWFLVVSWHVVDGVRLLNWSTDN